jgi:hypothetical protein
LNNFNDLSWLPPYVSATIERLERFEQIVGLLERRLNPSINFQGRRVGTA